MRRNERTRILVEGDHALARRIASEVESVMQPVVLDEPSEGLVMVKVRESAQRQLFYLGEALATTCRVQLGQAQGLGLVLGSDRSFALALAVVDAAFESADPRFDVAAWEALLQRESERIARDFAEKQVALGRTRVDFSTMDVEL